MSKEIKRMWMIAGPNGSEKSTLIETLQPVVFFGTYINADDIEVLSKKRQALHFDDFSIDVSLKQFVAFIRKKTTIGSADFRTLILANIDINNNILSANNIIINSYFASLIADFIKYRLLY